MNKERITDDEERNRIVGKKYSIINIYQWFLEIRMATLVMILVPSMPSVP